MKKIIYTIFLLVIASGLRAQQDPQFTQYLFNGLIINPAYAGYKEMWNAQAGFRKQWAGINEAPVTQFIAADGNVLDNKVGLGLHVINDRTGAQGNLSVYTSYAYRLKINSESNLAFGLSGGFSQYTVDAAKLIAEDMTDATVLNSSASKIIPDIRFGAYYSSDKYYGGFSVTDLLSSAYDYTQPEFDLIAKRDRHYFLTGGALFDISSDLKLKPSILLKEDFVSPTMLDLNVFLLVSEKIWFGTSVNTSFKLMNSKLGSNVTTVNSVSFLTEYFVNEKIRVGYSFDYSTSAVASASYGSHEITLGYSIIPLKKERIVSPRYF